VDGSTALADCRLLELRVFRDPRGNLTPIEGGLDIPFEIQRVFYMYDVPGGASRAGHAHRALEQVIVAVSGSFDVVLDDGTTRATTTLNRSYQGLYVPNLVWRELENFSSGAVCLVLASLPFDEQDYFRNYDEFIEHVTGSGSARDRQKSVGEIWS
jgi:dTDP-4-dehydrorhamnose 3,5-epimerase-like enzyme